MREGVTFAHDVALHAFYPIPGGRDDDERAARAVRLEDFDAVVPVMELLDVTADAALLGFQRRDRRPAVRLHRR